MTGSSNKIRGLFLAALMVLSVVGGTVAFTGTAAAANASPVSAVEYQNGSPAVGASADADGGEFEVVVSEQATVTDAELFVDGVSQGNVSVGVTSQQFIIGDDAFGYGDIKASEDAVLRLRWTNPDGSDAEVGNVSVTATSQNLTPASPATDSVAYEGEPLAVVTSGNDVAFDINQDGEFNRNRSTGENSEVYVFDTSGLDTGSSWSVVTQNDNQANLTLRNLGLTISAESTELTSVENLTAVAEARQANRDVEFELVDSEGTVVASQDGRIGSDGDDSVDFGTQAEGTYTVRVTDADTGNIVSTEQITVEEATGAAAFNSSFVRQDRGDVVRTTIDFSGTASEAEVTIGDSEGASYEVNFTVVDGNNDGQVVIEWNTYNSNVSVGDSASQAGFSTAASGDDIQNFDVADGVNRPVEAGDYPAEVAFGGDRSPQTISLSERTLSETTVHTAPGAASPGSTEALLDAVSAPTDSIALDDDGPDDWVVVRIAGTGLEGQMADQVLVGNAGNAFQGTGLSLTVTQTEGIARNEDPLAVNLSQANYYPAGEDDQYFVVFKPSAVNGSFDTDDEFAVEFTVDSSNEVTSEEETVSSSFGLEDGFVSLDTEAGRIFLQANEDAAVTGESNFAPGTQLAITLESTGGESPFVEDNTSITVDSEGEWSGTIDLSDKAEGQEFDASVSKAGVSRDEAPGVIGELTAEVTFSDQVAQQSGTRVTVDSAALSEGGFIAIHEGGPGGPVIGVSRYIEPGETVSGLNIRLEEAVEGETTLVAMAHKDTDQDQTYDFGVTDGEEDGPYTQGGSPVIDSATVTVSTPTPTPEPDTETPSPEPDTDTPEPDTDTPTPMDDDTPTDTPTPESTPGFGVVVALFALMAAALLAFRRD